MAIRYIAIAASKGGVGKTTLTATLAVEAAKDGSKVAMLDWEPQGSLTFWHAARGKPDNPHLIRNDDDPIAVAGWNNDPDWKWVFFDTAPSGLDQIQHAIDAADFVLIPVHASAIDIAAVRPVVALCIEFKKPFAFLLNEVEPRRKRLTESGIAFLKKMGPVLDEHVQNRTSYVSAINAKGKTAPEIDKAAAAEIEAVWHAVRKLAAKGKVR
jgi:chromosome partitioning protein